MKHKHTERPYRTASMPAWMAEGDDRVSCADCRHRRAAGCRVTGRSHVPVEITHRCDNFARAK